ncbi:hypothetical protein ACLI4U_02265 [Natrialbaceae archaeon A-CW2]|uniref:DUF7529 family protein n=1 Tax=Natronosalvus amylolyticus TaxID=2961994 RepID=UPI0020C98445|nr:hypothetical protein [Natronosalvus amylolyticus]
MSKRDDDSVGLRARTPAVKEAWKRTNQDMEAIAEERREDGWEVITMPSVHTSPVGREDGEDDYYGLVHVIPDNHADAFSEAFDPDTFTRWEAYRNDVDGFVFLVTELMDPESKTAILVAGQYNMQLSKGMVTTAIKTDDLYSHFKTINGTELGSVRYEEIDPFIPNVDGFIERFDIDQDA